MHWMRIALWVGLLLSVVSGCGTAAVPRNAAMKIEGRNQEQEILLGHYLTYCGRYENTARMRVESGTLVCVGKSTDGVRTNEAEGWIGTNFFTERRHRHYRQFRHTLRIECNDGRTGTMLVTSIRDLPRSGVPVDPWVGDPTFSQGSGSLVDGTKIILGSRTTCSRRNCLDVGCFFQALPDVDWDGIRAGGACARGRYRHRPDAGAND